MKILNFVSSQLQLLWRHYIVGLPLNMKDLEVDEDLMTIEEFLDNVTNGCLIDYDGMGQFATNTQCHGSWIYPSNFHPNLTIAVPKWATHVVWYNR